MHLTELQSKVFKSDASRVSGHSIYVMNKYLAVYDRSRDVKEHIIIFLKSAAEQSLLFRLHEVYLEIFIETISKSEKTPTERKKKLFMLFYNLIYVIYNDDAIMM